MIEGGCLCGAVRFAFEAPTGDFELCHCSRCRRATGSAFAAGLWVESRGFRLLRGREQVRRYEAPLLKGPPPYRAFFCAVCGSPLPDPEPELRFVEVPAGLLDGNPGVRPDKHLFFGPAAPWYAVQDELPQLDEKAITAYRMEHWFGRPAGKKP